MSVILLDGTENPERKIAYCARLCYSNRKIQSIKDNLSNDEINRMVNMILNNKHYSILEHVVFTFGIEGISRVASHQLVRHRMASYSHQSLRYTKVKNPVWKFPDKLSDEYRKVIKNEYEKSLETYNNLIEHGVNKEDARYILPNGVTSNLIITINTRSLFNTFKTRLCKRSQDEIRNIVTEMYNILHELYPNIFNMKVCGPPCISEGKCKESNPCGFKIK